MKNQVYFKKEKINSFNDILFKYGKKEFNSPYRSTIPLLLLFKSELWNDFNLINSSEKNSIEYFFEHETKVIKGQGGSSCTDLMIVTNKICICVEAKRTESEYEIVKKWLDNTVNKNLVLEGWLEIIKDYSGIDLSFNEIGELPYQLIHRVASACFLKKDKVHVIYLGFELNKTQKDYYLKSINSFSKLLNNSIKFELICFDIEKSENQKNYESSWDNGNRDLSNEIINGIKNDNLMRFTLSLNDC